MARRAATGAVRDGLGGFALVVGLGAIDEIARLLGELTAVPTFPWDETVAVGLGAVIGWSIAQAAKRPWLVLVPAVLLVWVLLAFYVPPIPAPPWVDQHLRSEPLGVGLAVLIGVFVYGGAVAARALRR